MASAGSWLSRIRLSKIFGGAPSLPAVRAGVLGAAVAVSGSYARGLLPRSASDQALATGVTASVRYLLTASTAAAVETVALYGSGDHSIRRRQAPPTAMLAAGLGFLASGLAVERTFPPDPDEPLQKSLVRFAGHLAVNGGAAVILVTAVDEALGSLPATRGWRNRSLLIDAVLGAGLGAIGVASRRRRARKFGVVDPDRPAVERAPLAVTAKAAGMGVVAAGGLLVVASAEQWVARRVDRAVNINVGPIELGGPMFGHVVALGLFGAGGTVALSKLKARVERRGDVVEAAYPAPPSSESVTAGPRSLVAFDAIGKEGRRFVLMALTPEEITAVMGPGPVREPIRAIGGYEAAGTTEERAALCLAEMEALGAFDRSLVCVASPTGVGYVSYVFAETLEYLTRGDCAIIMPQYALVPSALALNDTGDGARLQQLVLEGIAARVAQMPEDSRPKVVQFGESLGAQVALDIAHPEGSGVFEAYGLDGGLYLGVPFRTLAWNAWIADRAGFDPAGRMMAVSQPASLAERSPDEVAALEHLMVVHHDDPVNKFGYRLVVRPPWWMGAPHTRPPKVPREVLWRPVTTFVLTLIDLKNGMKLQPGKFVRRGHDYRIDTVTAVMAAYRLTATPEQQESIERALRRREVEWARKRLVARKYAAAREAITATLSKWGVNPTALDSLPDPDAIDLTGEEALEQEIQFVIADHDPSAGTRPAPLDPFAKT